VPGLIAIEDTLPLPGIDWQIDVDVEAAGRYGADVATVGAMVQLVTRGLLLDTMRVDSSDEEIEIRVRLPEQSRVLSTLDTLKVRTPRGLIPLANFITRTPVPKLGQIDRIDQSRFFDVKADTKAGLNIVQLIPNATEGSDEEPVPFDLGFGDLVPQDEYENGAPSNVYLTGIRSFLFGLIQFESIDRYQIDEITGDLGLDQIQDALDNGAELAIVPVDPNQRISVLTEWIETEQPFARPLV